MKRYELYKALVWLIFGVVLLIESSYIGGTYMMFGVAILELALCADIYYFIKDKQDEKQDKNDNRSQPRENP